jgi:hypothetical protein
MAMRRARFLPLVGLMFVPAAAWPQGNPVGPEFRVNTYTPGNEFGASLAADALGNFVVVWQSSNQDGSLTGIFGQRYAASGVPLGPEFRVNSYTTSNQFGPAVASDASGNFVVVWTSQLQDGSAFGIFGQRYASTGAPAGPEFRVNTYTAGSQFVPSLSAADAGTFTVAWMSPDGSDYGIFAQRYASTGTPVGPEFRVNTYTAAYQALPRIGTDPAGNFVVVWGSDGQDGSAYGIFGQRYASSGAPIGAEFRINTYTTGDQSGPEVDTDGTGNFVVVWQSAPQDGSGQGLFGQRFAASGAPVGAEFRVNTYTTLDQSRPSLALDSSGNFAVVWQSAGQDGSGNGVFGQRYSAAGAPQGPEFRVNTYVASDQVGPSVAADSAGDFVVAWSSLGQDGSNYGVFGQRYGPIVPVELMQFRVE